MDLQRLAVLEGERCVEISSVYGNNWKHWFNRSLKQLIKNPKIYLTDWMLPFFFFVQFENWIYSLNEKLMKMFLINLWCSSPLLFLMPVKKASFGWVVCTSSGRNNHITFLCKTTWNGRARNPSWLVSGRLWMCWSSNVLKLMWSSKDLTAWVLTYCQNWNLLITI